MWYVTPVVNGLGEKGYYVCKKKFIFFRVYWCPYASTTPRWFSDWDRAQAQADHSNEYEARNNVRPM
ncbi:hypothetical protein NVP1152O_074 [Vibrio phage 1.152.O._10N.222.46.E1]|uniref:Uncharacterized protein n=5 Tax=Nahantvirus 49C7 TaxID=2846601 RepID=A0A2I7RBE5_9CAUD|nr:hypothetical protein HYP57_gp073 [Vibrio phage 1.026.O._10N.222.49.C7]AUR82556.1 hypothetical protein NVP1025O_073 [Vibrio phage 1.025.O._10N.222.46.B6]AUR90806.1 hypothetical protein NVP1150O_073 [Vibrio phage 1.150.O._10N.222.46.A6]AUR90979.1 hypothetical protein NVP1152O_074 [Vibrio phage 1.152.O._10N.222.46.E1]AUS02447.1 hypothetical protein NVP2130O_073 [Vibrio phage 2.130.O._10N.222.46.C2]AUR82664.1 hypothetical protein NVP1026O_073 [Vibrio phage 1.026.O._10N.222.49.C7]